MKKILLVIALFAWVSLTINAQTKAPAAEKKAPATEKKAPVAQTKATTAPTKTPIEVAKLPKEILDNIANEHKGFKAIKAESITDKDVVTYKVQVEGNNTKAYYIYDKDKKFVKEEAIKQAVKKTKTTKTTKTTTKKVEPKPTK